MGQSSGVSSVMHCHVGMNNEIYIDIFTLLNYLHNPSGLSLFLLFEQVFRLKSF